MTVAISRLDLRQAAPQPVTAAPAPRAWVWPAVIVAAAAVCWAIALPSMRDAEYDPYGLLFAASPLFAASIVLGALGFVVAIARRALRTGGVALVVSVLLLRLPSALATEEPLYSWTYKHFGVIDYIQTYGSLASGVDVYHEWPGMFAVFAWLNTTTGMVNTDWATWFAVAVDLALAGAVYLLGRSIGLAAGPALVAGFIAQAANWVAQDYLSPQAVAFTLGIVVVALVLATPRSRASAWIALFLFVAIVVSHQLTPYWLIAVTLLLTILGKVRPRYLVVLFIAVALGYVILHLQTVLNFGNPLSFNLAGNASTNTHGANPSDAQVLSSWSARITAALVWVGAAGILVARFLRDRSAWREIAALATVAFSSVLILGGQSYGGEAILRVFLYSLPGCAVVLAPAVHRALVGGAGRAARVAAGTGLVAVMVLSAQAYFGPWFANRVTTDSLEVATDILENQPTDTLTIGVAPGAPGRVVARYVEFVRAQRAFDVGVDTWVNAWPGWENYDFSDPARFNRLTDTLVERGQRTTIVVTQQMHYYAEYYGVFSEGSLDRFTQILFDDPRWELVHDTTDVLEFRLRLEDAP